MNTRDWIALSLAKGIGLRGFWRLIQVFGSPQEVLDAPPSALVKKAGLHKKQLEALAASDLLRERAENEIVRLAQIDAVAVSFSSPLYPSLLKEIPDPPPVLFCLGDTRLLSTDSLAIVGSRASSSYGRRTAAFFASECVRYGLTIVSGLALGIDACAHEGALRARGKTIAVLGSGIDTIYPPQNRALYQKISKEGLIISEYPLKTRPDAFRFPARNRIIAGMSLGVLVVEAARKSGSLITAQMGLDFGREVFAVPGQVDSPKSVGSHWLLQQGAKLVQKSDDIVEELKGVSQNNEQEVYIEGSADVCQEGREILAVLEPYPVPMEKIMETVKMSSQEFSHQILMLEIEDLIELLPGNMVRKV